MRISLSTRYGLLAVGYFATHSDEKIIMSQTISKKYGIPTEYTSKILQRLVTAKILRSKRCRQGGFSLARPAKKITMLEVIEAVNRPIVSRLEMAKGEKFSSKVEEVSKKAVNQAKAVLQRTKIADLI